MRILIAPDKFKGSLGAAAVAAAIAAGLRERLPEAEIITMPIADGGEGTASAICAAANGKWHTCDVRDPLERIVRARYCTISNGTTAVMETSEASGLWRVPPELRDPLAASSFGTGEMLLHAARGGATEIILGLGGSATNDGGFGLARALGFAFLSADERELTGGVPELLRLAQIVPPQAGKLPSRVIAAVDVLNPLLGPRGATRVFAPQKGASAEDLELMEQALTRLADVAQRELGIDVRATPGAGAAGGLGFGLMTFGAAEVRPGFDLVATRIGLEEAVRRADVIITGEGALDAQTLEGKAPRGLAQLARRFGKPIHAIAGSAEENGELRALFTTVSILARPPVSVEEACARCAELLRIRAAELVQYL